MGGLISLYVALWLVFVLICWKVKDTPRNHKIAFRVFVGLLILPFIILGIVTFQQKEPLSQKEETATLDCSRTEADAENWRKKYAALDAQVREFLREHKRARRYFDDYDPN